MLDFDALASNLNEHYKITILQNSRKLGFTNERMSFHDENQLYLACLESISKEWDVLPEALRPYSTEWPCYGLN